MDKYEIIVVPDVRTLLWGIFSIFPILLPFYFPWRCSNRSMQMEESVFQEKKKHRMCVHKGA